MATRITTEGITKEESRILHNADDDFMIQGKTDAKCSRCEGSIVLKEYGSSYTIGCENDCVVIAFRGI